LTEPLLKRFESLNIDPERMYYNQKLYSMIESFGTHTTDKKYFKNVDENRKTV
jgi:hypothetical protein